MTFLTPGFLLAGAALAAIPILIHLLNRRRHQVVRWAAMRYLLEAMRQNRRRLRFESLALLLARVAAIALLALALARPIGCADTSVAGMIAGRAGLHVFVIDDSYSMAYEGRRAGALTNFDQAKRLAKQSINRLAGGGQQVAVIAASTPARVLVSPTHDLDAAADAVDRLQQSSAGTDLVGATTLAADVAERVRDVTDRAIIYVTDGTAGALDGTPALATAARRAADKSRLVLYDVGLTSQSNAAVLDVRPSEPFVRAGFNAEVVAEARGFGSASQARLDWTQDDRPLPPGDAFRLDANTPPRSNAQARFDRAGPTVVEVKVDGDGDRLRRDDVRRAVVDVVGAVKVLIVEGRRGLGALEGSGSFLRLALAPPVDSNAVDNAAARYVVPTSISEIELPSVPLDEYRSVVLAGVAALSKETADSLARYVSAGGSVILFMGDAVNADAYNATLGAAGLLPGALTGRVDAGGNAAFTFDFNPAEPPAMLNAFRNVAKSGLDTAQITSYVGVSVDEKRKANVVLRFKPTAAGMPGDPAIVEQSVGRGRVVFVATSADAEWTTLVAKPAYVALVHELLGGAVGGATSAWMNRIVGDQVELPASLRLTATPTLRDPAGRSVAMTRSANADGIAAWRSVSLGEAGLYKVEAGPQSWPIAVNLPATEADVRTLDAAAIRHAFGDVAIDVRGDALPDAGASGAGSAGDVGWPILALLLPILGVESFMAMRFSRGRGTTA